MIQEPGYRLNVGLIIINDNGKLLLCKRKNMNSWQFPQGGIDMGETPTKASKRDLAGVSCVVASEKVMPIEGRSI